MRGADVAKTLQARKLRRSASKAEQQLWLMLRGRRMASFKFVRQAPVGPFFADFVCRERRLVVELEDATSATSTDGADHLRRNVFLASAGYRVLRILSVDVSNDLGAVTATILAALEVGCDGPNSS